MMSDIELSISLPLEAGSIAWRVLGEIASPVKQWVPRDLMERIIRQHVSPPNQDHVVAEINGWFQSPGDWEWLKEDMRAPVAMLVLNGIGDALSSSGRHWRS